MHNYQNLINLLAIAEMQVAMERERADALECDVQRAAERATEYDMEIDYLRGRLAQADRQIEELTTQAQITAGLALALIAELERAGYRRTPAIAKVASILPFSPSPNEAS